MMRKTCQNAIFVALCAALNGPALADGGIGCSTAYADVSNYGMAGVFAGVAIAGMYLLRRR